MELGVQSSAPNPFRLETTAQGVQLDPASYARDLQLQVVADELYRLIDRIAQTRDMFERNALFRSLHVVAVTLRELRLERSLSLD